MSIANQLCSYQGKDSLPAIEVNAKSNTRLKFLRNLHFLAEIRDELDTGSAYSFGKEE
jgi:hypothetical protein